MFVWRPRALAWRLLHYAELDVELSGVSPSGGGNILLWPAHFACPGRRLDTAQHPVRLAWRVLHRAEHGTVWCWLGPWGEGQQQLLQLGSRLAGRAGSARSLAPVPAAAAKFKWLKVEVSTQMVLRLCECDHEMYVPLRRLARRCHRGGV